jgi:hypothetical protein
MIPISHIDHSQTVRTEKNYLLVKCDFCKKKMTLTEGSIIIGSDWYHVDCFNCMHDVSNTKSVSTKDPTPAHCVKNTRTD